MKRLLQPFVLVVTALLAAAYAYPAARLATGPWERVALAIPFVLIWIVPAVYWTGERDGEESWLDQAAHQASYLSMAWVSFILVLTLVRDLALLATAALPLERAHALIAQAGVPAVSVVALVAVALGMIIALRGPRVEKVVVLVAGLHPRLHGFRHLQSFYLYGARRSRWRMPRWPIFACFSRPTRSLRRSGGGPVSTCSSRATRTRGSSFHGP